MLVSDSAEPCLPNFGIGVALAVETPMPRTKHFARVCLAFGMIVAPSVGWGQTSVQLKFSRVVDLTLPVESNMAGIPGLKPYLDNPSRVTVISSITETQKDALR